MIPFLKGKKKKNSSLDSGLDVDEKDDSENVIPVYDSYNDSLPKRLFNVYKSKMLCDVTFLVGENASRLWSDDVLFDNDAKISTNFENKFKPVTFTCNRLFLCAVSPVFDSMLNNKNLGTFKESEKNIIIPLPEDAPSGFDNIIKYAYSDIIELNENNVFDTLQVSSKYQVKTLEKTCYEFLQNKISPNNMISILIAAHNYKQSFTMESCLQLIWNLSSSHQNTIVLSNDFLKLPYDLFVKFLASDYFEVGEEKLFETMIKWHNLNKNVDINTLIQHIRFPLIDSKYFVDKVISLNLLKQEDILSIFYNKSSPESNSTKFNGNSRKSLVNQISNKLSTPFMKIVNRNIRNNTCIKNQYIIIQYDFREYYEKPETTGNHLGWIGVMPLAPNVVDEANLGYFSLSNLSGINFIQLKQIGDYEISAYNNDTDQSKKIGGSISIKVVNEPIFDNDNNNNTNTTNNGHGDYIKIDRNLLYEGETLYVSYNFNNYTNNNEPIVLGSGWLGIIPSDITSRDEIVNDAHDISYIHLPNLSNVVSFRVQQLGTFEMRAFSRDNGGIQVGNGVRFEVHSLGNIGNSILQ